MPRELGRVLANLLDNAIYAALDRSRQEPEGFVPTVTISTHDRDGEVEIRIRDNGAGIAPEVREQMFMPFFTTKPTGVGVGLGLSLSHDVVVQQHGGQLEVESEPGQFTEMIIRLPVRQR